MEVAPDVELCLVDYWRAEVRKMSGERRCCHSLKVELRTDENCSNPDQTEG